MTNFALVSSFYWYQLPQLIQLLAFMDVNKYWISLDDNTCELGFNLYIHTDYNLHFIQKLISNAEWHGWFRNAQK